MNNKDFDREITDRLSGEISEALEDVKQEIARDKAEAKERLFYNNDDEMRPGHHHHHHHHSSKKHGSSDEETSRLKWYQKLTAPKNSRKLLIIVIAAALLLGCLIGVGVLLEKKNVLHQDEEGIWGDKALGIDPVVDEQLKNWRSVAFFGIDNGGRSDIILIICINEENNDAKIFPVQRDTYMKVAENDSGINVNGQNYVYFKCNQAYKNLSGYGAMAMLNRHMDLNIRECVDLDWDAIEVLVDEMGGLDVEITEGLLGHVSGVSGTGEQTLNGKQAIQYLRCRKDPGADATTRARRNEEAFVQLFERAKDYSLDKRIDIFEKVMKETKTNINKSEIESVLADITSYKLNMEDGWPYDYRIMWDGASAGYGYYFYVMGNMTKNVIDLHENIFDQQHYEPTDTVKELSKSIKERSESLHND